MTALQTLQLQFMAHLRAPDRQPLPDGCAEQGMRVYADLLFNKFNDSLQACFPVCAALLGERGWQTLVKTFVAQHACRSPLYRQIPDEFVDYLQTAPRRPADPPWLLELAHFEWLELALAIAEAEPPPAYSTAIDDWLPCRPLFAPVLQIRQYAYPVARLNADCQPAEAPAQATYILGFRDRDDEVQFVELNPATARLLEILHSGGETVAAAINRIAAELKHPQPAALNRFGIETLYNLMQQGAILGARTTG